MSSPGTPVKTVLLSSAHESGVGGVQLVLRDLVKWLEQNGREACFIYAVPVRGLSLVERVGKDGRRTFHCPMPAVVRDNLLLSLLVLIAYLPITLIQLTRLIRRHKIDVINCHYLDPYFIHLVLAARLQRIPIIVSVHGADIEGYRTLCLAHQLICRLVMRWATRVVACSQALARRTTEVFPSVRPTITYVHNGLDLSHYEATTDRRVLPARFLLCVCRHVHKKGVDTLVRAFSQVVTEFPDVSLVLVGDGPLLEEHRGLARSLQLEHAVMFVGNVPHAEVPAFFEACTLFVLPSRNEPFGLVLLEAAYYRKPIVCTRVGGVPEIIADGVDGLMVDPDDPEAMARRILELLRNPGRALQMGEAVHQTLVARFLWSDRIRDYIDIFEGGSGPSLDADPGTRGAPSSVTSSRSSLRALSPRGVPPRA